MDRSTVAYRTINDNLLINESTAIVVPQGESPSPSPFPPSSSLPPPEMNAFDGIRGICSILVVIGHLSLYWSPNQEGYTWPVIGIEFLSAVSLFFVISGFTLTLVYDTPSSSSVPPVPTTEPPLTKWSDRRIFFIRRIGRLAPVYYVSLMIALAPLLVYHNDIFTLATSIPLTLLWLQSIPCLIGNEWNGPLWTASAFALIYLMFPSLLRFFRTKSVPQLRSYLFGLVSVSITIATNWIFRLPSALQFFLHAFFIFRIPQFAMGICGALIARTYRFRSPLFVIEACTIILLINQGLSIFINIAAGIGWLFAYQYIAEYVLPIVHIVWLIALSDPRVNSATINGTDPRGIYSPTPSVGTDPRVNSSTVDPRGINSSTVTGTDPSVPWGIRVNRTIEERTFFSPTKWFLTLKPCKYLGEISYSLYCLHWPLLNWLAWIVKHEGISNDAVPSTSGFYFFFPSWSIPLIAVYCIVIASIFHYALESPARKAIRKLVNHE